MSSARLATHNTENLRQGPGPLMPLVPLGEAIKKSAAQRAARRQLPTAQQRRMQPAAPARGLQRPGKPQRPAQLQAQAAHPVHAALRPQVSIAAPPQQAAPAKVLPLSKTPWERRCEQAIAICEGGLIVATAAAHVLPGVGAWAFALSVAGIYLGKIIQHAPQIKAQVTAFVKHNPGVTGGVAAALTGAAVAMACGVTGGVALVAAVTGAALVGCIGGKVASKFGVIGLLIALALMCFTLFSVSLVFIFH